MQRNLIQAVATICLAFFCAIAAAQEASVAGKVKDTEGAVIPGATVEIVNQDKSIKRQVTSDQDGNYSLQALPAGTYQIAVRFLGFSSTESGPIILENAKTFHYDATLAVAAQKQEVEVTTEGSNTAVDLSSATLSTTLSPKEVTGYGLNGRSFAQLIDQSPGVSNQTGQDEAKVGVAGSAKFSVNGGRVEYNTFEVDGSDVLNTSINASRGQGEPLIVYPSIDAIQEIKVLTANYSAVYGKSASGSVLITTKSGSDKFHGNAYEFIRNEAFNARNYFAAPGRTPLYRRQDFGGTIGGPLFVPNLYNTARTKTFFFWSEEARFEKTPVAYNQAVPTAAERQGNFSDVCPVPQPGIPFPTPLNLALNPDCPQGPNTTSLPSIPVDHTAAALLSTGVIPEPNLNFGCNTTNATGFPKCYIASISPRTTWREELFRIDHKLTSTQQLSFRYVHDSWMTTTLSPQWGIVPNSFPTVENSLSGPGLNLEVSLAGTLPRGFVNRASVSYTVEHIALAPVVGPGANTLQRPPDLDSACSTSGCPAGYIFANGFNGGRSPGLAFQGNNTAYGGHGFAADTGYAPWHQTNPTYDARDDASRTVGHHILQFGVNGTLVDQNEDSAVSGANSGDTQGLLTFSNQQSRYTTGNAFADFLSGSAIKSFTQDSGRLRYYNRYKVLDLYLQDDWQVSRRLTINVGLRASLFGPWYNSKSTAYNWLPGAYNRDLGSSITIDPNFGELVRNIDRTSVPLNRSGSYCLNTQSCSNRLDPVITNGLRQCGAQGVAQSCQSSRVLYPGPRLGLSYDPSGNGKTAIHAGYGLFWEHGTGNEANAGALLGSAPLILSETQSNINTYPGANGIPPVSAFNAIGFSCQGGTAQCAGILNQPSTPGGATFPLNVTSIPDHAVYPYTQQWSLSVQRELKRNLVGQVAYVGGKATHLSAVQDLNQLQPLGSGNNPFASGQRGLTSGQPVTASVCQSGAASNVFSVTGGNPVGGPPTIPTSPGIGPTSPGYTNLVVACTGNPGFRNTANQGLGTSADSVRPYPGFSNIIAVSSIADSEYDAFQGTLRATTGPITLNLAYTYSHSLDDASDRSSANFANSLDVHSNHASSDFDQRHLLNVSYIYDLPLLRILDGFLHLVGSGSDTSTDSPGDITTPIHPSTPASNSYGFGKLTKGLLDGWELSGITFFQTGTPFSVINAGTAAGLGPADNAGVGDGLGVGSYADVVGNARGQKPFVAPGLNEGPLLRNPAAFAAPRGLTFGNSGRNFLNNPSRTNFNMSLLKHFKPFGEGRDVEFRIESFNVFNHTQFRITDPSNPGNTGNNIISCYGSQSESYSAGAPECLAGQSFLHPVDAHDPRILQFGLKASF